MPYWLRMSIYTSHDSSSTSLQRRDVSGFKVFLESFRSSFVLIIHGGQIGAPTPFWSRRQWPEAAIAKFCGVLDNPRCFLFCYCHGRFNQAALPCFRRNPELLQLCCHVGDTCPTAVRTLFGAFRQLHLFEHRMAVAKYM